MSTSAGSLILQANRFNNGGQLQESVKAYLQALNCPMDQRSRFIVLYNLGNTYKSLGDNDSIMRNQRRCEAVQAWTEALSVHEGHSDRASAAMAAGEVLLEDGFFNRARSMFKLVIDYDNQKGNLTAKAHARLGITSSALSSSHSSSAKKRPGEKATK